MHAHSRATHKHTRTHASTHAHTHHPHTHTQTHTHAHMHTHTHTYMHTHTHTHTHTHACTHACTHARTHTHTHTHTVVCLFKLHTCSVTAYSMLSEQNHALFTQDWEELVHNIHTTRVQHEFAKHSLRYTLPRTINNTPNIILNKIYTHSLHGFATYINNYFIQTYNIVPCTIINCYICQ